MSRFQKSTLLIGVLILLLLVALIAVVAMKPTMQSSLSPVDQTGTWAVDFAATHAETIQAIQTGIPLTLTASTSG